MSDVIGSDYRTRREPRLQHVQNRKTGVFPTVKQHQADRARHLGEGSAGHAGENRHGRATSARFLPELARAASTSRAVSSVPTTRPVLLSVTAAAR